jgi:hypothetical protein
MHIHYVQMCLQISIYLYLIFLIIGKFGSSLWFVSRSRCRSRSYFTTNSRSASQSVSMYVCMYWCRAHSETRKKLFPDVGSGKTLQKTTLPTDLLETPMVLNSSVFACPHTLPRRRVYQLHCLATAVLSGSAVGMCLQRRCLTMYVVSSSTISAFGRNITLHSNVFSKIF